MKLIIYFSLLSTRITCAAVPPLPLHLNSVVFNLAQKQKVSLILLHSSEYGQVWSCCEYGTELWGCTKCGYYLD